MGCTTPAFGSMRLAALARDAAPTLRGQRRWRKINSFCAYPARVIRPTPPRDEHVHHRNHPVLPTSPTLHRRPMARRRRPQDAGRARPGHRQADRQRGGGHQGRPRCGLCGRRCQGFEAWRKVPAFERAKTMREAARLLRERADGIARWMTQEQGKPLVEAKGEIIMACDIIEWFAEEGRRVQGRILAAAPGRRAAAGVQGAGGPGGGLHAVELPDQPGGAQAVRRH